MKRYLASILIGAALLGGPSIILSTGCSAPSGVTQGDPVVVNSEKAIEASFKTVDAFLKWEHENPAVVTPAVHAVAQDIRRKAPDAFRNARAVLRAYKQNRTPEQKALLDTWLATISELARVATETSKN
jgi:hypothetical protein